MDDVYKNFMICSILFEILKTLEVQTMWMQLQMKIILLILQKASMVSTEEKGSFASQISKHLQESDLILL